MIRTNHAWIGWLILATLGFAATSDADDRPHILLAIADDWGWPHAGVYGDQAVPTPTFDRLAREGVLFQHAFVSSPSCTPSRNALLTGQYHWRLGGGANLWSRLETRHRTYPLLLESAGYFVGHWRKSWGPGKLDNWPAHPAGPRFEGFAAFLDQRPQDRPFCFWLGASDPHRPYAQGSGRESGIDLNQVHLFPHNPDCEVIRSDVADYYFEVQRFDRDVGEAVRLLEQRGLLQQTLIAMTGDHGMPFPRCKANCYDSGARVPLAIRWPDAWPGKRGRVVEDFVSLTDLAPTFLDAAGEAAPEVMTGRSLLPILASSQAGQVNGQRDRVFFGKERHTPAQEAPDRGGTPMRAVRTADFLLIHNLKPHRWPAGTPHWERSFIPGAWLSDCDNGPTKTYLVEHQEQDETHRRAYQLCFGKRPEYELYELRKDPGQLENVASDPTYRSALEALRASLASELQRSQDPRARGEGDAIFDPPEYFGGAPKHPQWKPPGR